jgi:hypothetical protein
MHSPLSMQAAAHLRDASGPAPVRTISRMPPTISPALASVIPACYARADLDAFAATRAGVEHLLNAPI